MRSARTARQYSASAKSNVPTGTVPTSESSSVRAASPSPPSTSARARAVVRSTAGVTCADTIGAIHTIAAQPVATISRVARSIMPPSGDAWHRG
jgi:hypothetical protein